LDYLFYYEKQLQSELWGKYSSEIHVAEGRNIYSKHPHSVAVLGIYGQGRSVSSSDQVIQVKQAGTMHKKS